MLLLLDHYDSYVYNLKNQLCALGAEIEVRTPDQLPDLDPAAYSGIVLSPGPGHPREYPGTVSFLRDLPADLPLLGVCLGHQILAEAYGAKVVHGTRPMHGKVTLLKHNREGLCKRLPQEVSVTRYHSLVVDRASLPDCLTVDAVSEDGAVMALRHRTLPRFGVQFHPEAVRTECGDLLLSEFLKLCRGGTHA